MFRVVYTWDDHGSGFDGKMTAGWTSDDRDKLEADIIVESFGGHFVSLG